MPQDGSNNYQYPPGTPGIPDTTIESEAYNTFLDDLVINDLNIPRPVHRGGTGASTADAALANLHGEKAEQVVTAYLSQLWLPGSFRSAIGATDAPVAGHSFSGICYINEPLIYPPTNANVTVEARDMTDGKLYVRQKLAGTWGAWIEQSGGATDLEATYVNVIGDTMTGHLSLPTSPAAANAVRKDYVDAADAGKVAKAGDTMTGPLVVNGTITTTVNNGFVATVPAGQFARTIYNVTGVRVWSAGGHSSNGSFFIADETIAASRLTIDTSGGSTFAGTVASIGYQIRSGLPGPSGGSFFNFNWTGALIAWIDSTNVGNVTLTSDYRIKKDVIDLPGMWDTVKALRPIKYTQAQFSPPSHVKHVAEQVVESRKYAAEHPDAAPREVNEGPLYPADNIERWGFIAHELQETLTPSAATGVKDAPDIIQAPNPFTLIAALTKALQEAMARIEALEAQQTP